MAESPEPTTPRPSDATNSPPPSTWAHLDADYNDNRPPPPEVSTQLPTSGFSWRFYGVAIDPPADLGMRLEFPALVLWGLISCFWQGFLPWALLGGAWMAYALGTRLAFRQYKLGAQTWVYCAMGLGQILLSFSFIANIGPFLPFIGLYWLGVGAAWAIVEFRSLFRKRKGGGSVY